MVSIVRNAQLTQSQSFFIRQACTPQLQGFCLLDGGEHWLETSLIQLVRNGSCRYVCSSTHQTCAADMRAYVDSIATPSVKTHGGDPAKQWRSRALFVVITAVLLALLLLVIFTVIRMCVLLQHVMLENGLEWACAQA
jgi:hypothetical protein